MSENTENAIVSHIAATAIKLDYLFTQRCIVCGEAIIKKDLRKEIPVKEGDSYYYDVDAYQENTIVEIVTNSSGFRISEKAIGTLTQQSNIKDLPKSICLRLVEL